MARNQKSDMDDMKFENEAHSEFRANTSRGARADKINESDQPKGTERRVLMSIFRNTIVEEPFFCRNFFLVRQSDVIG